MKPFSFVLSPPLIGSKLKKRGTLCFACCLEETVKNTALWLDKDSILPEPLLKGDRQRPYRLSYAALHWQW